jgi:hypothetical protein
MCVVTVEIRAVGQVDVGPVEVGPIGHAEAGGHLGEVQALAAGHLNGRNLIDLLRPLLGLQT